MRRFTAVVAAAWIGVQASAAQAASKSPGFPHKAAEAGRWSLLIAAVALVIVLPLLLWLIGLIFGGIGDGVGGLGGAHYKDAAGASSTTQRTLTIIIKFDNQGHVRDYAYHASSF